MHYRYATRPGALAIPLSERRFVSDIEGLNDWLVHLVK